MHVCQGACMVVRGRLWRSFFSCVCLRNVTRVVKLRSKYLNPLSHLGGSGRNFLIEKLKSKVDISGHFQYRKLQNMKVVMLPSYAVVITRTSEAGLPTCLFLQTTVRLVLCCVFYVVLLSPQPLGVGWGAELMSRGLLL